jgi:hypothetical protein
MPRTDNPMPASAIVANTDRKRRIEPDARSVPRNV